MSRWRVDSVGNMEHERVHSVKNMTEGVFADEAGSLLYSSGLVLTTDPVLFSALKNASGGLTNQLHRDPLQI